MTNPSLAQALEDQRQGLLACVHCGFCLPACPTYRRLGDEADSPRGRLSLMQAVVEGRLEAGSDAFQTHIGRCLGCRACEPACPAGVTYGRLLELARHVGREAKRLDWATRLLLRVFGTPWLARPAMAAARWLRATRLPALGARLPLGGRPGRQLRMAAAMLAASAPQTKKLGGMRTDGATPVSGARPQPATATAAQSAMQLQRAMAAAKEPTAQSTEATALEPGTPRAATLGRSGRQGAGASVALLGGCVQAGLFGRVNAATRRVLETNGYRIVDAPGQGCCGALHAHAGDLHAARAMARRNVDAFAAAKADFVGVNASGCGAAMADYLHLLARDRALADAAATVAASVRDVSQLLGRGDLVRGAPVPVTVACDEPCHLIHAQGVARSAQTLLQAVPALRLVPLPKADECCGGAGIYGLVQPELGGRIGGDKVDAVLATGADAVATGNPGCIMQIGGGLRLRGHAVAALHPVELLDESYGRAGFYAGNGGAPGDPARPPTTAATQMTRTHAATRRPPTVPPARLATAATQ